MKKTLIISIIFLIMCTISYTQENTNHENQIGVTYSPEKKGLGLIFISPNNLLLTVDKGYYKYPNEPKVNITKVGIGTLIYEYEDISKTYISVMYNQNTNYSKLPSQYQQIINDKLIRISIEMTGIVFFNDFIGASISYDFINFEGRVGIILKI